MKFYAYGSFGKHLKKGRYPNKVSEVLLALRLERASNQGFGTIVELELVLELLSAIVKLRVAPVILLACNHS